MLDQLIEDEQITCQNGKHFGDFAIFFKKAIF